MSEILVDLRSSLRSGATMDMVVSKRWLRRVSFVRVYRLSEMEMFIDGAMAAKVAI